LHQPLVCDNLSILAASGALVYIAMRLEILARAGDCLGPTMVRHKTKPPGTPGGLDHSADPSLGRQYMSPPPMPPCLPDMSAFSFSGIS
jgi:hypothetical protein